MRKRAATPPVAAVDRHADRVAGLVRAVLESDAVTENATRAAAATPGTELPSSKLASYLTRVRDASYRITDADVDALVRAGHDEEEIFELTVAAALGAAMVSRDAGLRAVRGEA